MFYIFHNKKNVELDVLIEEIKQIKKEVAVSSGEGVFDFTSEHKLEEVQSADGYLYRYLTKYLLEKSLLKSAYQNFELKITESIFEENGEIIYSLGNYRGYIKDSFVEDLQGELVFPLKANKETLKLLNKQLGCFYQIKEMI